MGNDNVDVEALHFHIDFNGILQDSPWVPRAPQDYIWKSPGIPRDVLGVPTYALRLLSDALEMHLGPPWAPQGLPRHTPGLLLHAQTSTEPPNGHPDAFSTLKRVL